MTSRLLVQINDQQAYFFHCTQNNFPVRRKIISSVVEKFSRKRLRSKIDFDHCDHDHRDRVFLQKKREAVSMIARGRFSA